MAKQTMKTVAQQANERVLPGRLAFRMLFVIIFIERGRAVRPFLSSRRQVYCSSLLPRRAATKNEEKTKAIKHIQQVVKARTRFNRLTGGDGWLGRKKEEKREIEIGRESRCWKCFVLLYFLSHSVK